MRYIHRLFTYVSVGLHRRVNLTQKVGPFSPRFSAAPSPPFPVLPFPSPPLAQMQLEGLGELPQRGPGLRANLFFGYFKPRKHVWWH